MSNPPQLNRTRLPTLTNASPGAATPAFNYSRHKFRRRRGGARQITPGSVFDDPYERGVIPGLSFQAHRDFGASGCLSIWPVPRYRVTCWPPPGRRKIQAAALGLSGERGDRLCITGEPPGIARRLPAKAPPQT